MSSISKRLTLTVSALLIVSSLAALQSMAAVTYVQQVEVHGLRVATDKASYQRGDSVEIKIYVVNREASDLVIRSLDYEMVISGPTGPVRRAGTYSYDPIQRHIILLNSELLIARESWSQNSYYYQQVPPGIYTIQVLLRYHENYYGSVTLSIS